MKKLLTSLVVLAVFTLTSVAFADGAANVRIKISGALPNNTYFLCMQNVGCLSILAAARGKIYPVFHQIPMDNIYVANVEKNFRLTSSGLPQSCDVKVQPNQTITIFGHLTPKNGNTYISGLRCSVA